jgi:ribosomal protein L15E
LVESMDQVVPSRLERLQAGATKNEQDLVRLRQRIEELRFNGQRTTEPEAVFQRFETTHQGLLAKLDTLRREQAAAD